MAHWAAQLLKIKDGDIQPRNKEPELTDLPEAIGTMKVHLKLPEP